MNGGMPHRMLTSVDLIRRTDTFEERIVIRAVVIVE